MHCVTSKISHSKQKENIRKWAGLTQIHGPCLEALILILQNEQGAEWAA